MINHHIPLYPIPRFSDQTSIFWCSIGVHIRDEQLTFFLKTKVVGSWTEGPGMSNLNPAFSDAKRREWMGCWGWLGVAGMSIDSYRGSLPKILYYQWIGLRENLQEPPPYFMVTYMVVIESDTAVR